MFFDGVHEALCSQAGSLRCEGDASGEARIDFRENGIPRAL
jgi:hypothetical protein